MLFYAYNPDGDWTNEHQMSLSGKTDNFELDDLISFGRFADLKIGETKAIISDIQSAIAQWADVTSEAGVPQSMAQQALNGFRPI